MGHDEHGPAYPDRPYECPICGGDKNRFITCEYPMCPDGCDQRGRFRTYPSEPTPRTPHKLRELVGWACFFALLLYLMWPAPAPAMDHGFDRNSPVTKWMEKQIRPDSPPNSCCGIADGYPVDNYEKLSSGEYRVWIQNGDAITFPDGTKRAPWDITVPLIVPQYKINPLDDDLDNPTDHGWLFFRPATSSTVDPGSFFCFIRHPRGQ